MYEELVRALRETHKRVKRNPDVAMHVPPYQLSSAADAIEELNRRISFLMNCIYEAEDALDRGTDNEWARNALEKTTKGG